MVTALRNAFIAIYSILSWYTLKSFLAICVYFMFFYSLSLFRKCLISFCSPLMISSFGSMLSFTTGLKRKNNEIIILMDINISSSAQNLSKGLIRLNLQSERKHLEVRIKKLILYIQTNKNSNKLI